MSILRNLRTISFLRILPASPAAELDYDSSLGTDGLQPAPTSLPHRDVIDLKDTNGEVPARVDIQPTTEAHGELRF